MANTPAPGRRTAAWATRETRTFRLARLVGVSNGSVYLRWPTLEKLILAAAEQASCDAHPGPYRRRLRFVPNFSPRSTTTCRVRETAPSSVSSSEPVRAVRCSPTLTQSYRIGSSSSRPLSRHRRTTGPATLAHRSGGGLWSSSPRPSRRQAQGGIFSKIQKGRTDIGTSPS